MKKIIVTGSASGFGLLTVQALAKKGHTVYATMRNVTTKNAAAAQILLNWAEENNADVRIVELDITSDASVQTAVTHIAKDAGQIDVLINNAGLMIWGLSETLSTSQVEQVFQVNVFGSDRMNKAVLPYMHQQNSGLLIHLSSGLSRLHLPYMGAYSAAKAAIDILAETLQYELRETGIDSVVVQPGAYPTTDLFNKLIPADNPAAAQSYGAFGSKIEQGIVYLFTPTPESPDPIEVAQLIADLAEQPKGERKAWSAIGLEGGQATIEGINTTTEQLSLYVQGALGIIA
jgi:NAD(P)-dependent dehydrogenase (short-subunit alcohol dehydrogenase family)